MSIRYVLTNLLGLLVATLLFTGCNSLSTAVLESGNFCSVETTQTSGYAGGDGSASTPYLICKPSEFAHLMQTSADWTANFQLLADLDLSSLSNPTPVGTMQITNAGAIQASTPFTGTFDGGHFAISGLTMNQSSDYTLVSGLFGYTQNATIKNLTIKNAAIVAMNYSAVFIGYALDTTVSDVSVLNSTINYPSGGTTAGSCTAGYIAKYIVDDGSSRSLSNATVTVTGTGYDVWGGLLGFLTVTNSSSVEMANNSVTTTLSPLTSTNSGNTLGGFVAYDKIDTGTINVHDNTVNSTLSVTINGAFSGAFVGTLECNPCTANFDSNRVTMNWSNPATFNGGYVGGFLGVSGPASGSVVSFTKNFVTGSLTIPDGGVSGRSGFGGFIGDAAVGNGVTATIENNGVQVDMTILVPGSSYSGGFIGSLSQSGTGVLNFGDNYLVGAQNVTSPGSYHGGMIGYLSGTLTAGSMHSYYSSDDYAAGIGNTTDASVAGLTRAQMQDSSNFSSWDFATVWQIVSGQYPTLR